MEKSAVTGSEGPPVTVTPCSRRTGTNSAVSSSSLFIRRYSRLYHFALSGLNLAPAFWTLSSEKAWISSSREKSSRSSPGFQPSIASRLTKASGKYPSSR